MNKSDTIDLLAAALTKFQGSMEAITKDSSNPFFKSKYASLSAIIEDTRTPLYEAGLSYAQFPEGEAGLTTILMHTSGQWMSATYEMHPADQKPQSVGSALTYMRRYALCAILGLQVEDDDGNEATKPQKKSNAQGAVITVPNYIKKDSKVIVTGADDLGDIGFEDDVVGWDVPPPSPEEQREEIRTILKKLKVDVSSKKACEAYVADLTQLALTEKNYPEIIKQLKAVK